MTEEEQTPDERVTVQIFYQDKDITDLVKRAKEASKIIENFRIVGRTVSGDPDKGFSVSS
jgi:hypothetical protein